ncbi:MAG: Panacea domain-containing protein [Gemmatimonadaceae bacterium]
MAALKDVLAYLLLHYPHKSEMSNARVTKMVYLADWKHVLDYGTQMTEIPWYFDNYGPYVPDIMQTALEHSDLFDVDHTVNPFGHSKTLLSCSDAKYEPALASSERKVLDSVIQIANPLSWDQFIGLVYSTFPVVRNERYSHLDLVASAREYKLTDVWYVANAAVSPLLKR